MTASVKTFVYVISVILVHCNADPNDTLIENTTTRVISDSLDGHPMLNTLHILKEENGEFVKYIPSLSDSVESNKESTISYIKKEATLQSNELKKTNENNENNKAIESNSEANDVSTNSEISGDVHKEVSVKTSQLDSNVLVDQSTKLLNNTRPRMRALSDQKLKIAAISETTKSKYHRKQPSHSFPVITAKNETTNRVLGHHFKPSHPKFNQSVISLPEYTPGIITQNNNSTNDVKDSLEHKISNDTVQNTVSLNQNNKAHQYRSKHHHNRQHWPHNPALKNKIDTTHNEINNNNTDKSTPDSMNSVQRNNQLTKPQEVQNRPNRHKKYPIRHFPSYRSNHLNHTSETSGNTSNPVSTSMDTSENKLEVSTQNSTGNVIPHTPKRMEFLKQHKNTRPIGGAYSNFRNHQHAAELHKQHEENKDIQVRNEDINVHTENNIEENHNKNDTVSKSIQERFKNFQRPIHMKPKSDFLTKHSDNQHNSNHPSIAHFRSRHRSTHMRVNSISTDANSTYEDNHSDLEEGKSKNEPDLEHPARIRFKFPPSALHMRKSSISTESTPISEAKPENDNLKEDNHSDREEGKSKNEPDLEHPARVRFKFAPRAPHMRKSSISTESTPASEAKPENDDLKEENHTDDLKEGKSINEPNLEHPIRVRFKFAPRTPHMRRSSISTESTPASEAEPENDNLTEDNTDLKEGKVHHAHVRSKFAPRTPHIRKKFISTVSAPESKAKLKNENLKPTHMRVSTKTITDETDDDEMKGKSMDDLEGGLDISEVNSDIVGQSYRTSHTDFHKKYNPNGKHFSLPSLEGNEENYPMLRRRSRENNSFQTKDYIKSTNDEANKESDHKETLFSADTVMDDSLFESTDHEDGQLFDIGDMGTTESPPEKVTVSLPNSFSVPAHNSTKNSTYETVLEPTGLANADEMNAMQEYINNRTNTVTTEGELVTIDPEHWFPLNDKEGTEGDNTTVTETSNTFNTPTVITTPTVSPNSTNENKDTLVITSTVAGSDTTSIECDTTTIPTTQKVNDNVDVTNNNKEIEDTTESDVVLIQDKKSDSNITLDSEKEIDAINVDGPNNEETDKIQHNNNDDLLGSLFSNLDETSTDVNTEKPEHKDELIGSLFDGFDDKNDVKENIENHQQESVITYIPSKKTNQSKIFVNKPIVKYIFGKKANFTMDLQMQNHSYKVPSNVRFTEDSHKHVLNFTWSPNKTTRYTISLNLSKNITKYYEIETIHVYLLKDGNLTVWMKNVTKQPNKNELLDHKFTIELEDDMKVVFSNTNFLIADEDNDIDGIQSAAASEDRESRIVNVEIAVGVLIVLSLLLIILYLIVRRIRIKSLAQKNRVPTTS